MLEIYGRRNSSNVMSVMWTVGELGLPHVRHNVGGSFGGLDDEKYQVINPNGVVPTIDDDGFTLWESNAIVRYLSRKYGRGTLWPDDPGQCAKADQWMDWFKTTAYPAFMPVFLGMIRTPAEDQNHEAIASATANANKTFKILDDHLKNNDFVAGEAFSMGDIPLGAAIYRYLNLDIERPSLPGIEAWYARICQREAYQNHAMVPFGRSLQEWQELETQGA